MSRSTWIWAGMGACVSAVLLASCGSDGPDGFVMMDVGLSSSSSTGAASVSRGGSVQSGCPVDLFFTVHGPDYTEFTPVAIAANMTSSWGSSGNNVFESERKPVLVKSGDRRFLTVAGRADNNCSEGQRAVHGVVGPVKIDRSAALDLVARVSVQTFTVTESAMASTTPFAVLKVTQIDGSAACVGLGTTAITVKDDQLGYTFGGSTTFSSSCQRYIGPLPEGRLFRIKLQPSGGTAQCYRVIAQGQQGIGLGTHNSMDCTGF